MRTILICSKCSKPVRLNRRAVRVWNNKAGFPFICETCQQSEISRAVEASQIAKAEAVTRAFQTIHLNPTTHENPKTRTHPARL
jgi:protein-arginine kinase activator protein McsA